MVEPIKSKEELVKEQGELLNKLKATGFEIKNTPEFKGILKDLEGERTSRQQMSSQVEQLQEQLDLIISEKNDKKKGRDRSELLTIGDAEDMLKNALDKTKDDDKKNKQTDFHQKYVSDEKEAKSELTADKMGDGLDYSSVIEKYKDLLVDNPGYNNIVVNAGLKGKNMAKTAYDLVVKFHPDISKKVDAQKNEKLLEDLKTGKTKHKGQAGVLEQVRLEEQTTEQLLSMSEEEILKSLKES